MRAERSVRWVPMRLMRSASMMKILFEARIFAWAPGRIGPGRNALPELASAAVIIHPHWDDAAVSLRLRRTIRMLDGYHAWNLKTVEEDAMVAKALDAYKALTLDQLKYHQGWESFIKGYQDISAAQYGGMAQRGAMEEIALRFARASVRSGGAETLRADLNGNVDIVRQPMAQSRGDWIPAIAYPRE